MKENVVYKEISCRTAINKINSWLPYRRDLNVYRGCLHSCAYCFARYSHDYLEDSDFDNHIYVKTNIAEALETELAKPSWAREIVNLGGVTDSYQPAEAKYKLMPDVWKLLTKYRTPALISTKSALILRDIDLIAKLAEVAYVSIAVTITCMDEDMRQIIEPNTSSSARRFEILQELKKTKATRGLHFMPIIPYLTDNSVNINAIFSNANKCNVDYVIAGLLNLRGKTKTSFMQFINKNYPQFGGKLAALYIKSEADPQYKEAFKAMMYELRQKYGLSADYMGVMKRKLASYPNVF